VLARLPGSNNRAQRRKGSLPLGHRKKKEEGKKRGGEEGKQSLLYHTSRDGRGGGKKGERGGKLFRGPREKEGEKGKGGRDGVRCTLCSTV